MVYSLLSDLPQYIDSDSLSHIKDFLHKVRADMPEGEYPILGEKIFARVMGYRTDMPEHCRIEAHDKYIDIQATISGAEGISVFERCSLTESLSYDQEKDVVFFHPGESKKIAQTINLPGYFTMLFPEEAHRPQEQVKGFPEVKKFVIKLAR